MLLPVVMELLKMELLLDWMVADELDVVTVDSEMIPYVWVPLLRSGSRPLLSTPTSLVCCCSALTAALIFLSRAEERLFENLSFFCAVCSPRMLTTSHFWQCTTVAVMMSSELNIR